MKKLIISIATFLFAVSAMAQDTKTDGSMSKMSNVKFCAKMSSGKLTVMHGSRKLTADTTLSGGIIIKADGTIVKANGTQQMLKNGDCVDQNGNIMTGQPKKAKSSSKMN